MSAHTWSTLRGTSTAKGKIRVLVVDDQVVIRHLIMHALRAEADIDVVGEASNGAAALERVAELHPDVITLDIEMPVMDGIAALREIRKLYPRVRVIMFSTLTTRGAASTFEALSLGADDYVAKASNAGSMNESLASLRGELVPKIRQFFATPAASPPIARGPVLAAPRCPAIHRNTRFRILGIGVSTGGPQALCVLIPQLPVNFPLPVVIVQHMPAMFTRLLAERLDSMSPLRVVEAANGMPIRPGSVYVAKGGFHLRVRCVGDSLYAALDEGPQENSCRPAVDVLFRSLTEGFGKDVLSVVLTGMGSDGLRGTEVLKAGGGYSLVQDKASSVVWGMPGSVAGAGLADGVFPLSALGAEIIRLTGV